MPDSRGRGSPRPAGKGMRPGWGGVGGGSLRPGGRLSLGTALRPAATFPGDPPSLLGFSKGITRRLLSAAPRGSSGRLALSETGRWDFPLLLPGRSTLRQPPERRQPSLSRPLARCPASAERGRPGEQEGGGRGALLAWSKGVWGEARSVGRGESGPREGDPVADPRGLASGLQAPACPAWLPLRFLSSLRPPPPAQQSLADCSPGGEREGKRLLRRGGKEAAEALRHAGGCLRGRARPASPPDRLSWSVRGPRLPHGRGWLSDSASRELARSEGAHGRGDWELKSPQLMARDGTEVRPGNPVAAGIQGPPCSLEDDEVFLGTEARPSTTQADPFRHCSVEELYELLETLGSGHFGVVRRCQERSTGVFYAAKSIKVRKRKGSRLGLDREQVEREVCILQQLQHPNIMRLYDVFANQAEMVLILELIQGGELFDFIAEKELVSEDGAIEFLQQILLGLAYMHAHRIAHFDLKPENIMLLEKDAPSPKIKIIDFGLAQKLEEGVAYKSLCGTPQYIAPEVINYEALSTATDMWSIGVITYILLSGMSPFQGETDEETLSNVVSGNYEFEAKYFSQTSEMAKDFIQKLLLKEPRDRMTAAECLLHPWIKPLTRKQAMNRSRSSINMKNFRKFNARRKWKLSYHMVSACNRLGRLRLLCLQQKLEQEAATALRDCESDQEDQPSSPGVLLRRRRSICS